MAGRIFISYRRADTANQAGWLAERLAAHYGRPQVIKDVDAAEAAVQQTGVVCLDAPRIGVAPEQGVVGIRHEPVDGHPVERDV